MFRSGMCQPQEYHLFTRLNVHSKLSNLNNKMVSLRILLIISFTHLSNNWHITTIKQDALKEHNLFYLMALTVCIIITVAAVEEEIDIKYLGR